MNYQRLYDASTLAAIGLCAIAHLITTFQSGTLFTAVMPIFGVTACSAYGLLCFASAKRSPIKLLLVAGALTTFWIQ